MNKKTKNKQSQQLVKMGVFVGLGIIFLLSMWFIFKPSAKEQEKEIAGLGLNETVPQATTIQLPEDKSKAYEKAWQTEEQQNKKATMNELADYFEKETVQKEENSAYQSPYMLEKNAIGRSVNQYQSANKELANFYTSANDNTEKQELREKLQELKAELEEERANQQSVDEQLQLMEKSYEMAAKYMPQGTSENPFAKQTTETPSKEVATATSSQLPITAMLPKRKKVVSILEQSVSDSVFMQEQAQERNRSFYSLKAKQENNVSKNTLKVCIHQTTLLRDGETVQLRLLENAQIGKVVIPTHSLLSATAKVQGNRLLISVKSIAFAEQLIGVELSAFDLDGQEGIFIPGSSEMNALKEVAANMGGTAGQSFTFSSSTGQQLAADMGKGLLKGTSKYINKKLREVKVTLKAGHLLYLVQNK